MLPLALSAVAALASLAPQTRAATYPLSQSQHGTTFFDGWTFYGNYDNTTNGDVQYANASDHASLAYVDSTTGHAIVKVSTDTVIYENKRNSVRIGLDNLYDVGTVWVMDAVHVPYGCSVWPSWWTTSLTWPSGGEIDIIEAVNKQTSNQMALHTTAGCTLESSSTTAITGTFGSTNCNSTDNSGCEIYANDDNSFGDTLNSNGGGVWVMELATTGVSIWFYKRSAVPSTLNATAATIDTSSLGTPVGFWPSTSCSPISDYIYKQQTVIDITLCGDWAGVNTTMASTGCTEPTYPGYCYSEYVVDAGALFEGYTDAYWEISYMNVYSTSQNASSSSSVTSTSSAKASGSASATKAAASASASAAAASTKASGALPAFAGRVEGWALAIGAAAVALLV